MKNLNNGYFFIGQNKESFDTQRVVELIKQDNWVNSNTIFVNCAPEYSSILTQTINHKLSYLFNNELFEVLPLEMPYPIMNQIWNSETRAYDKNDYYVKTWLNKHIYSGYRYLFINAGKHSFDKFKLSLQNIDYKLCSLYTQEENLVPDYYAEQYNKLQGKLLYHWENSNNPNW